MVFCVQFVTKWLTCFDALQKAYTCGFDQQEFATLGELQEHTGTVHCLPESSLPFAREVFIFANCMIK